MNVPLALEITKYLSDRFADIPHDIGISIVEIVERHQTGLIQCSICHKHTKPSDIENNALGKPVCLSCWNGNILFK